MPEQADSAATAVASASRRMDTSKASSSIRTRASSMARRRSESESAFSNVCISSATLRVDVIVNFWNSGAQAHVECAPTAWPSGEKTARTLPWNEGDWYEQREDEEFTVVERGEACAAPSRLVAGKAGVKSDLSSWHCNSDPSDTGSKGDELSAD
eukprot:scaffold259642_cov33-Tisochrysis_lutea.AAC.1